MATMKTIYWVFFLILSLLWGCKQKESTREHPPEASEKVTETAVAAPLSAIIKELGQFADLDVPDATAVERLIDFKKINGDGDIKTIDMETYIKLYQLILKNVKGTELPIYEIRDRDRAILMMGGKGFGGPVWAKVLVDKATREISKIEFDHRLESDGYGAGMSESRFENQFIGAKVQVKANTYGLDQTGKKIIEGTQLVDGLSGATTTSSAAVYMVNEGLLKYSGYLNQMK
jgi:Na+-transporting NADH:ubiquinone oxidoreductase subunit C